MRKVLTFLTFTVLGAMAISLFGRASLASNQAADLQVADRSTFLAAGTAPVSNGGTVSALSTTAVLDGTPFPHVFAYGGPNAAGWPFVGSTDKVGTCSNNPAVACAVNTDCGSPATVCNNLAQAPTIGTPLNSAELDAEARFPLVVAGITPLGDGRPDIITGLRARNPKIKVFGYATGHAMWCPQDGFGNNSYPAGYYFRDYYLAVNNGDPSCTTTSDRWLWNQDGTRSGFDVNLAHRVQNQDGSYTYDVAEAIANTIYAHANAAHNFDGIFIDIFCPGYLWAENQSNPWDYARAGYGNNNADPANKAAFDAGWLAGYNREASRLRELAVADGHPDYPITGNCAQAPASVLPVLNGWMREGYPFQNGGTFNTNILTYPWGYLQQDYLFRAPQYNYIFTAADPSTTPYTSHNQQKMRFGLGSATLGNGYHAFEDGIAAPTTDNFPVWWFDEYGVDTTVPQSNPDFGKAKSGAAYAGWLGQPQGDWYHMMLPNANPELIPTNTFEQDITHISLHVGSGATATAERQTTGAAVGIGDLHVHISQTDNGQSSVYFNSDPYTDTIGTMYSLTFWAKADVNRNITVFLDGTGQDLPITTAWKKYQVSLRAAGSGSAVYQVQLGDSTGDVWFDDMHIQAGLGNVLRRDFDHGTVLVDPYDAAVTVPLEKPFKKILGTVNPTLNDGSIVNSVTLTPDLSYRIGDAIFLLKYDPTPPAAVTDLQASSGQVSITSNTKVRPDGLTYRGKFIAKQVKFRSLARVWNIIAPLDRSSKGAIFVYDVKGKLKQTLKPFGSYAPQGLKASLIIQPGSDKVFLAITSRSANRRIAIYQITTAGVALSQTLTVAPRNGSVLLSFVKLSSQEYALATAIGGQRSTLGLYQYNPKRKQFLKQPKFNLRRLALTSTKLTLIR